jgi:hypothetical protein
MVGAAKGLLRAKMDTSKEAFFALKSVLKRMFTT